MGPRLFRSIFLGLSLLTLSKTESGITCREGSGVEDPAYCPSIRATWCEAVNGMQLVLVCSSCEGAPSVEWEYDEMKLNETTAQLTLPPDRVMSGCYRCSCKMYTERRFAVEARNAEKPFLMVPNSSVYGITYLSPQPHYIELTRSSTGNITVNCTAGGWPTPKVNWSSDALSPVSSDPCVFTWDDGFVLQKVIPMDPLEHGLTTTDYICTLYNLVGTLTASQTIIYKDVNDYFLKPAQDLDTSVEVGKEGYCAVYPEPGTTIHYTVCLVPNNSDAEICPLIAHDESHHCCLCGSPDCEGALGGSVNTSLGLTPADANWPGVVSCVILSPFPLTFDCFAQRLSSEVTSLRQFTGSISYYVPNLPTSASEVYQIYIPVPLAGVLILCIVIICVLSGWLYHERHVHRSRGQSASVPIGDRQEGAGAGRGTGLKRNPNSTKSVSLEEVKVPFEMDRISDFIPDMAPQWSAIGCKLSLRTEVNQWMSRQERNDEKCLIIINAAIDQKKLTSWEELFAVLESDAVKLHDVVCSIRERYCQSQIDVTDSRCTTNDDEPMLPQ